MSVNPFIAFAIQHGCLSFGDFTLKSGRQSPYFFNAGKLCQGQALAELGQFYAQTLISSGISFDVLFGPAYKGIPIATTTAVALHHQGIDVEVAFDRKEVKKHGDGGQLIGASLKDKRVVIIDDVFTAGTAFRHAYQLVTSQQAQVDAAIIALDRQEKGLKSVSSVQEISNEFKLPVLSVAKFDDIRLYLQQSGSHHQLSKLTEYREQWGE